MALSTIGLFLQLMCANNARKSRALGKANTHAHFAVRKAWFTNLNISIAPTRSARNTSDFCGLYEGIMGLFDWLKGESAKGVKGKYDWKAIGYTGLGSEKTDDIPDWVLKAYSKCQIHHNGIVYRFNGRHYQYKVVESGQGAANRIFYRRLRKSVK